MNKLFHVTLYIKNKLRKIKIKTKEDERDKTWFNDSKEAAKD